jgi:hypothetical protein
MLYAFDLLELDGVDYRPLPLGKRKERLEHLVDRRLVGIVMNEPPTPAGSWCSSSPVGWASRASCRNVSQSRISPAGPGTG